jgi:hypothetical protein
VDEHSRPAQVIRADRLIPERMGIFGQDNDHEPWVWTWYPSH